MRHRHRVHAGDGYRMRPGYTSFDVADSASGPVLCPADGRILMPLYQAQGDDGFFLVREVRAFWIGVSALLRRLRFDRIAPLLPGVRRHGTDPASVVVDLRLARWWAVEVFHLLDYRRRRRVGHALVMTRRHFDEPGLEGASMSRGSAETE